MDNTLNNENIVVGRNHNDFTKNDLTISIIFFAILIIVAVILSASVLEMNESKLVKRTHELMLNNNKFEVAIDATVGNGYDTLFLSNHYKRVIGIDIQELAVRRSKEKTKNIGNVEIFLDDFNGIEKYEYANLIIFNLGFLPGSNRKIKTHDYTPNMAILKAYSILDGILIVACYIQHEGGYDEYLNIVNTLDINNIVYTIEDDFENKEKLIIIKS